MDTNQRDELFGKIWWEDLNGPRKFLDDVSKKLSGGKSVVLSLPEHVPWFDIMHNALDKLLRRGTQSIEVIDAPKISEPQKYVMKEFCDNKDGFRPFNKKAYAKFLATRTGIALNNTCLWIRNADEEKAAQWFSFMSDYHECLNGKRGGVFLLETSNFNFVSKRGVEVLFYEKHISDYDSFAFNIFTAADFGNENRLMKQYLAELVSALTKGNVEFGSACIERRSEFLRDPHEVFGKILHEGKFSSTKTDDDIDQDIWTTQLKLIFPLVETFRRDFIKRYEDEIRGRIPFHTGALEELEIGALYGLFINKREWISANDIADLEFYREVRNKLAHLKTLPFDELQKLFDKNSAR